MLSHQNKINLELVANNLRNGFYLDDDTLTQDEYDNILKYVKELELSYSPINKAHPKCSLFFKNANLIKDASSLGEILGYYCHNHHNYYDHTIDRYLCEMLESSVSIYCEIAQVSLVTLNELKNFYQEKVNKWNDKMPQYKFNYKIFFMKGVEDCKDIELIQV